MPASRSSCLAECPAVGSTGPRSPTPGAAPTAEPATIVASQTIDRQLSWRLTPDPPAALPRSGPAAHLHSLAGTGSPGSSPDKPPEVPPDWAPPARPPSVRQLSTKNIADSFADLLKPLSRQRRRGIIAQLSVGFYEGWRPTREEIAELVAVELGTLSVDDHLERQRCRTRDQLDRTARAALRMRGLDRLKAY